MTPEDRRALAQQLLTNPLMEVVLQEMEQEAVERSIYARLNDDNTRLTAMLEVRAIRDFRTKLEQCAEDNRSRKAAPA